MIENQELIQDPNQTDSNQFTNKIISSIFNGTITSAEFINSDLNNTEIIQLLACLACDLTFSKTLKRLIIKNANRKLFKTSFQQLQQNKDKLLTETYSYPNDFFKQCIYNDIKPAGYNCLFEALKTNNTLTSLHLINVELADDNYNYLSEALKVNKVIIDLHIYDTKRFNEENVKVLSDVLKVHNLESFHFIIKRSLQEEWINLLILSLTNNKTLTKLTLQFHNFSDDNCVNLSKLLQKINIKYLDLNYNFISEKGLSFILNEIVNKEITTLKIAGNELKSDLLVSQIISKNKLEYLDISSAKITNINSLKNALLSNTSIKTLKINSFGFNHDYVKISLTKIDFITDIIKVNKTISKLQLRWNEFENVKPFLEAIKNNKTITNLNIEGCKLYDEDQKELIEVIKSNKTIEKLNLNLCFEYDKDYQNKIHLKNPDGTRKYSFEEQKEMIKGFKHTYNDIFLDLLQYNSSIKSLKIVDNYRNTTIFNETYDDIYINKITNIIKSNKTLEYLELDDTIPIICDRIKENNRIKSISKFNTNIKLSDEQYEKINASLKDNKTIFINWNDYYISKLMK